jgi:hypothetical protein
MRKIFIILMFTFLFLGCEQRSEIKSKQIKKNERQKDLGKITFIACNFAQSAYLLEFDNKRFIFTSSGGICQIIENKE